MAIYFPRMTQKIIGAFGDSFNNIQINRKKGKSLIEYTVPIKMGDKEKVFAYITKNTKHSISLPVMGFIIDSIDFDEERVINPQTVLLSNDTTQYTFAPVPYNYTVILTIYTKSYNDVYDIFESIVPNYRKTRNYPLNEFKFLDGSVIKRDLPISIQSTLRNIPEEISWEEEQIIKFDMTFLIKGWIYNPINNVDGTTDNSNLRNNNTITSLGGNTSKLIEQIDLKFEEFVTNYHEEISLYKDTGDEWVIT
jgi:T4-like virus Myoviridae tail sheath stabiliser